MGALAPRADLSTVLVVEHDADVIRAADHVINMQLSRATMSGSGESELSWFPRPSRAEPPHRPRSARARRGGIGLETFGRHMDDVGYSAGMRLVIGALAFALAASGCRKSESDGAQTGAASAPKSRTTKVKQGELDGAADEVLHLDRYTTGAQQIVRSAQMLADERHHKHATSLHLVARLLELKPVQQQFVDVNADPVKALTMVNDALATEPTSSEPSFLSADALSVLRRAEREAGTRPVALSDLINACIRPVRAASIADLDREGIETNASAKLRKIVESAHLDRILPGAR
jgi:hypothetical protein